ncbi:hypothetical protein [Pseudomonas sp. SO81]|uniref:hypothetical protein n=1 Tax=Pseudomonas sp. SO81 TaxID=2983246 RepID=UPI0025A4703B|nr:hypothetical protein [Pseudomonas sp. SO81]WJN58234.1 hypothetical protein OH686_05775 [Pseudomonas sp. SO81]
MEFWKPSVRKLATTTILVVAAVIHSCSSGMLNEFFKGKLLEPYAELLEKRQGLKPKAPELTEETQQAMLELIKSAEYQRLLKMGYLNMAIQGFIGIFLAYFAACLIHRKKKLELLAPASADNANDAPTPAP